MKSLFARAGQGSPGEGNDQAADALVLNPPWKSRSVWIAFLLVLLGGALWIKDARAPSPASPTTNSATSSFAENAGAKPAAEKVSPLPFRLGISYIGGYFLGWGLRRFLKLTLLVTGAVITLIAVAQWLGWFDIDWEGVEGTVREGASWLHTQAKSIKAAAMHLFPSATAAVIGAFLGFRRS